MQIDNFVDIHTHVLPGVDDGSESMKMTLQMIQLAKAQGINTIIATPHYARGAKNKTPEYLQEVVDQVQQEVYGQGSQIKIYLGNELYYSESLIEDLKTGKCSTMAGSRYVLIEFYIGVNYSTLYKGLNDLIVSGYAPILAHVERYQCLNGNMALIGDLVELGSYIQMNAGSLIGSFFSKGVMFNRKLVKNGLVHFIASDCHNDLTRPPIMESVRKILEKSLGTDNLENLLVNNPRKVLENKYI